MTNGVIILNAEGDIVRMNAAASRILGYALEQWQQFTPAERLELTRVESPDGKLLRVEELPAQRALKGEVVRDFRSEDPASRRTDCVDLDRRLADHRR